jgi:hypothetical protein
MSRAPQSLEHHPLAKKKCFFDLSHAFPLPASYNEEKHPPGGQTMKLNNDTGSRSIRETLELYPGIGVILDRHGIGCSRCSVGTCLLQDVVAVHFLGGETETRIEQEINDFLASLDHVPAR